MICRTLLVITLTSCILVTTTAIFEVNEIQSVYQAEENHNVTLEWKFTPKSNVSCTSLTILCGMKADNMVLTMYNVHDGVELAHSLAQKFSGRVQGDTDALKEGIIRINLLRVTTDDSGQYLCQVKTDHSSNSASCEVIVTPPFKVNVTQSFYQAEENHNITLEWKFTTRTDKAFTYFRIHCFLITDLKVSVIFKVYDGVEVPEYQDEQFLGRVQNDKDGLKEGRIRIQISRLRTNDSGRYRCNVKTHYGYDSDSCQLNVTAAHQLQSHTPTLSPDSENSESRGRTGLYLEAAPVLLVVFYVIALLIYRKIKGRQNLTSQSEILPLREMSGDLIHYNT